MTPNELYAKILGIKEPWYVDLVELDEEGGKVDVYVKHHNPIRVACPECGVFQAIYDHLPERTFRHLNTCQLKTYIHVNLPRVNCKEHGIKQVGSDFSEPNSHVTFAMESRLIDLLCECTIEAVCRLDDISWDIGWGIAERAVDRGLQRKRRRIPEYIGVDEKSFAKGQKYETIVVNHACGTVEYVVDGNNQESLGSYFRQFSSEELARVKAVTMDMAGGYRNAVRAHIPDGDKNIVYDRFHVMRLMVEAVDKVRRSEHLRLLQERNSCLKGTRFLWLWNKENVPEDRRLEFAVLRDQDLQVGRAWSIKENLRNLWDCPTLAAAQSFFSQWYGWAIRSRLAPVKKVALTIKTFLANILTFVEHRLTNALAESVNSKIEKVKRLACGFRNRGHYRTMIYFHCGGLSLYPSPSPGTKLRWAYATT
jgi:transposase